MVECRQIVNLLTGWASGPIYSTIRGLRFYSIKSNTWSSKSGTKIRYQTTSLCQLLSPANVTRALPTCMLIATDHAKNAIAACNLPIPRAKIPG